MKSEQSIMLPYVVGATIVVATAILPNTQIAGYNLLQNSLLSSATSSYVKSISMRSARVQALRGKYAFVPTSSEEFAARKQKEIEQGLA